MDPVSHAITGYCIAGWPGAVAATVTDLPIFIADMTQLARGRMHPSEWRHAEYPPPDGPTFKLLAISDVLHSAWAMLAVFAGPVGIAFASHAVIDAFFHRRTWLLPPYHWCVRSRWKWPIRRRGE